MTRVILAIFISVVVHSVIAVGIAFFLDSESDPVSSAGLEVTSVELSFSETVEAESAPAADMPSPMDPERMPDHVPPEARPPAEAGKVAPCPPEADAMKLPDPVEHIEQLVTPEIARQPPAPRQARIDAPPVPKRNIRPEYPKGARRRGEQGDVVMEIAIDESGTVTSVRVLSSSGSAELDEAAVKAVKSAGFVPARSGRENVASTARLTLTFRLK